MELALNLFTGISLFISLLFSSASSAVDYPYWAFEGKCVVEESEPTRSSDACHWNPTEECYENARKNKERSRTEASNKCSSLKNRKSCNEQSFRAIAENSTGYFQVKPAFACKWEGAGDPYEGSVEEIDNASCIFTPDFLASGMKDSPDSDGPDSAVCMNLEGEKCFDDPRCSLMANICIGERGESGGKDDEQCRMLKDKNSCQSASGIRCQWGVEIASPETTESQIENKSSCGGDLVCNYGADGQIECDNGETYNRKTSIFDGFRKFKRKVYPSGPFYQEDDSGGTSR